MGFFKDLKQLSDTGKQMQRDAGIRPGFAGMKDAVAMSNQALQGLQQADADSQRLMATGTVATGIVKGIRDTGTMVVGEFGTPSETTSAEAEERRAAGTSSRAVAFESAVRAAGSVTGKGSVITIAARLVDRRRQPIRQGCR